MEEICMSDGHRIDQLKAKHAHLEDALDREERKPQPDQLTVADLKKQKLLIKDELSRYEDA
tara:strand:- start:1165 stop:1347 length:183 start_codon:yes stop_codon:yes gene_type:complete